MKQLIDHMYLNFSFLSDFDRFFGSFEKKRYFIAYWPDRKNKKKIGSSVGVGPYMFCVI